MADDRNEYTLGLGAAAFLAGVSYNVMLRHVQQRTIPGVCQDGRYFTSADAVRSFLKRTASNNESPTEPVAA